MQRDLLKELQYLGLTARIKRLSDALSYSIRRLYEAQGVDIEPSWHLLFLLLKQRQRATMTEVATILQLSQPAVTKMIKKMVSRGYIDVIEDADDGRKRQLELSARARTELPRFERIWEAGQRTIREMLETDETLLHALERFEQQLSSKSFEDRTLEKLT